MGNRVWGQFTILKKHEEKAKDIIERGEDVSESVDWGVETVTFDLYESDGGGWEEARYLRDHEIPYMWVFEGDGGEWSAGGEIYIPGEGQVQTCENGPKAFINKDGSISAFQLGDAKQWYEYRDMFYGKEVQ